MHSHFQHITSHCIHNTPHSTTAQTRHFVVCLGLRVWCWWMGGVCFVCVVCVVFIGESRSCVVVVYFCLCVSYRGVILYGDCVSCVCWGRVFCCGPRSMITYVVLMSSFHVALLSSCLVMFFVGGCRLVMFFVGGCRHVVVVMLVSCDTLSVARKHSPRHFHWSRTGDLRHKGTVVVLTINHADWRLGVVCFTTRKNSPGPDTARIHRLIALSWFYGWWCMAVLSWWSESSG